MKRKSATNAVDESTPRARKPRRPAAPKHADRPDLTPTALTPRVLEYLSTHSEAAAREVADALMGRESTDEEFWAVAEVLDRLVAARKVCRTGPLRETIQHLYWLAMAAFAW